MSDSENSTYEPKKTEIMVFPNTGHHYFFIPFDPVLLAECGGKNGKVARACRADFVPWEAGCKKGEDKHTPWLRYRMGKKGDRVGLWVAIETNIGTIERGNIIGDPQESITPENFPENEEDRYISPYAYNNLSELVNKPGGEDSACFELSIPHPENRGQKLHIATLDIVWKKPAAAMDVDLVVDFGNTRTVVLAVENKTGLDSDPNALAVLCRPIYSLPRGVEYPDLTDTRKPTNLVSIVDSWFLLQDPVFSEWDYPAIGGMVTPDGQKGNTPPPIPDSPYRMSLSYEYNKKTIRDAKTIFGKTIAEGEYEYTKTTRKPHMFVEISPALMGTEAKDLLQNINLRVGLNVTMSSPKRYLWDRDPIKTEGGNQPWGLNPNPWSNKQRRNALLGLQGEICRYMYPDGNADNSKWDIEKPPFEDDQPHKRPHYFPENPCYPRCTAMVWSALSILENAYRQITSESWRKNNQEFVYRRLAGVHVTFPSGWIAAEKRFYRQAWQQAVDIFTLAHMQTREEIPSGNPYADGRPKLYMELDEAVASQLPFIYSEINRLRNANLWIKLYGRKDSDEQEDYLSHRVRVMTVDIGGGTSDSTIIEYRNDAPGDKLALRYKVLFRDCSSFAGDTAMLNIIERVLLPAILMKRCDDEETAIKYRNELNKSSRLAGDKAVWQRIVSTFFIPVVQQWLTDIAKCATRNERGEYEYKNLPTRTLAECGADATAIADFNKFMSSAGIDTDLILNDDTLEYSAADINDCIVDALQDGIAPLGRFIAAYDIDLVTLSGKISEMPCVAQLLKKLLPIREQRIIPMKNFLAGAWYPMNEGFRITDAKTVTAVGAAYYAAQSKGLFGAGNIHEADNDSLEEEECEDCCDISDSDYATNNYWGTLSPRGGRSGFDEIILEREEDDNSEKIFKSADSTIGECNGTVIQIGTCIGRMKYKSESSIPEQQYEIVWTGPEDKKPMNPLVAQFQRRKKGMDDDIRLIQGSVTPTHRSDAKLGTGFINEHIKMKLRTLPRQGFWKETCCFDPDLSEFDL
ncbi:MAG: virulence factor SrfB [Akkermansia sp.]|nr:virulence factor SrfB [Akkermansia sp.]